MFINRYNTKTDTEKGSDADHFNKFFKKIKKRQLKKQGLDANLSKKKAKLEVKKGDDTKNPDLNLPKDLTLKNSLVTSDDASKENFTIIGDHSFSKNNKVKAVLPRWLSNPELIQTDLTKISCPIPDLNCKIMLNLKEKSITNFFPVQQAVVPCIMKQTQRTSLSTYNYISRDICVSSLAYVLPIVQGLINRLVPRIRCLVVVPDQELAEQVANVFRNYIKGTSLRVVSITGGKGTIQGEQEWLLKKIKGVEGTYESLVDIVVTTPGRLVEHLQKTEGFNLRNLKYLVIDEADRVIDGIQNDWLFYLEKHLGQEIFSYLSLNYLRKRKTLFQKLLFSATLSQDPEKLKKLNLFQPILFTPTDKNKGASDVTKEIAHKRITNLLKKLTKENFAERCPLIWRLTLWSTSTLSMEESKRTFFLAAEKCPWIKMLYYEAAKMLPEDLPQIQDLLVEKELRLHITPEELEILREGPPEGSQIVNCNTVEEDLGTKLPEER